MLRIRSDTIWNNRSLQGIVAFAWNRDPCDPPSHSTRLRIKSIRTSTFFLRLPAISHICSKRKARPKRESKNAKQMRNTKQNCFSHSSASPRNDKQCSAKQCFANQTNRYLAGFASRSDLFWDNAWLTKHRRKVNQRHLILQAMYTTMWLEIDCWLAVSHVSLKTWFSNQTMFFFVPEWRRRKPANVLNRFVLLFLVFFLLSFAPALRQASQYTISVVRWIRSDTTWSDGPSQRIVAFAWNRHTYDPHLTLHDRFPTIAYNLTIFS